MGTIDKYLLPVRTKIEYKPREDGSLERVCYVACNNGEILTGGLPFDWAEFITRRLNSSYYAQTNNKSYNNVIAVLRIEGNPLEKTDAKMGTNKNGKIILQDNPIYTESIRQLGLLGEHIFTERWAQLPITSPVSIACEYHLRGKKRYNIALCNAWVLDILNKLNIIKATDQYVVESMDGSRFFRSKGDPYVIVKIIGMG